MRTKPVMWTTALVAAAVAGTLAFSVSAAQAQNKCLAGKTKCVNKKVAGLLKCHEKCQKDPAQCGGAQTACENKVLAKFNGASNTASCFSKLEAKNDGPCVTTGDKDAIEAKVDAFVTDITCELNPTTPECAPPLAECPPQIGQALAQFYAHSTAGHQTEDQYCEWDPAFAAGTVVLNLSAPAPPLPEPHEDGLAIVSGYAYVTIADVRIIDGEPMTHREQQACAALAAQVVAAATGQPCNITP